MSTCARTAAHLVIGGGLAGSMVAIRLAAAGREVVLLERECTAHHKVCGEFLSREAVEYLDQAGVNPLDLGAKRIHFVRFTSGRRIVEAALPFPALSLSRWVLDEAMLQRAAQAGCRVERGAQVESLAARDGVWRAELRGDESWCAAQVFLATGKHDLRGWERKPGRHGDLIGFKMHWRLAPAQTAALRAYIELFLFPGGYGGLSLVEEDVANFCFVVCRATLRAKGGWTKLLAAIRHENPHIAGRLEAASPLWERPLAVSSIPYGHLAGRPCGLWCVGDQAAVIPSFTGDGTAIALHSGALAAQMVLAGQSAEQYHQALCAHLARSISLATALSRAMVSGVGRMLAPIGLSLFPGAMQWIAQSTRVPENALLRNKTKCPDPQTTATR
ncbi:MAG TPA: FAD-dependent monooxygenase [Terracidiphilus sp.]|nr:FAD-dependent monooxygenase [Terracidiphilus sp.]